MEGYYRCCRLHLAGVHGFSDLAYRPAPASGVVREGEIAPGVSLGRGAPNGLLNRNTKFKK